jgi:hypothetical protein
VRVVRKVSGLQMLPDTPRLLKSQRLSGSTTTVTFPTDSSLYMESTPQYKNQLCLEVGLVTPDGMAPLGTATFVPGTSSIAMQRVVPVDRIATASRLHHKLFLARKKAAPNVTAVLRGSESLYRLSRNASLTVSYAVQSVATSTSTPDPNEKEVTPSLTRASSTPLLSPNTETMPDSTDEVQKVHSAPFGVLSYMSDPLSCCSGDETFATTLENVDKVEEEVAVASPEPMEDAALPRRDIVFEDPTIFQDSIPVTSGGDYWCCCWLPICCGGASSNQKAAEDVTVEEDTSDARVISMLEEEDAPVLAEEAVPVILEQPKELKEKEIQPVVSQQDLANACVARDTEVDDFAVRMDDYGRGDEMSQPEQPNCFMSCLGDEDVENLKYAYMTTGDVDPRIPPVAIIEPQVRSARSAVSDGESNIHEDITVPASGGKKEIHSPAPYDHHRSQSHLERVLDTKSSSFSGENGDEEENTDYTTSFSETFIHEEEETGCFPCLAVMSSEGEMSSSFSQNDSLSGMTQAESKKMLANQEIGILSTVDGEL